MAEETRPFVIRKIVKDDGHHGGSWKIAFADFAIAMMAFFLLLWILGATDERQKGAISEYFQNPSRIRGTSDMPSPTPVQGPGGAMTSLIEFPSPSTFTDPPLADIVGEHDEHEPESDHESEPGPAQGTHLDPDEARELAAELEKQHLESLQQELEALLESHESLVQIQDQLLIDMVPEGLRIQIVDKQNRPMFDLGSDKLKPHTQEILELLADSINTVPNRISITGHTDAHGFPSYRYYSNWELSADRANSARRALLAGGLHNDKIEKVVGRSASDPFNPDDHYAPENRRISIIVLNAPTNMSEQGTENNQF